jgi:hypothetical protein
MTEPSETQNEVPVFKDGDTLTIKRGKFGGQSGTVLIRNLDGRYVVKLADGNVTLVEPQNTRAPAERVITEGDLVKALQSVSDQDGELIPGDLYAEPEKVLPGIRGKVVRPDAQV